MVKKIKIHVNDVRQFLFGSNTSFGSGTRSTVTFILDYDEYKGIVGIELLGIKQWNFPFGQIVDELSRNMLPSISFDNEANALYLKLSGAKSTSQEAVNGNLLLSESNIVVGFELLLEGL